jgi:prolyl-tRNA editing enzyme YbaK/EbsC (Cys-tRNA(Pro) deacylase)
MHSRAAEFQRRVAEEHGVDIDVHEFPEGTKTAEDAAASVGCDVAQIASGLVFTADDRVVMVVTSGANRVDEDRLAAVTDADIVEMADPDTVQAATGYSIGGVPPFCHDQPIPVYVDESLLAHEEVWAAAATPQAVFPIDPDRLVELSGGTPIRVA